MKNRTFEPVGLDELKRQLVNELPKETRKIARNTARAAIVLARNDVKASVPVRSGTLKRSVYAKVLRDRAGQPTAADMRFHVGKSHQKKKRDGFYWRFLDKGTKFIEALRFKEHAETRLRARMPAIFLENYVQPLRALWRKRFGKNV